MYTCTKFKNIISVGSMDRVTSVQAREAELNLLDKSKVLHQYSPCSNDFGSKLNHTNQSPQTPPHIYFSHEGCETT